MIYNFDKLTNRHDSDSVKWHYYGKDVLPMWVADMDFVSPRPVLDALHRRINHGVFGYGSDPTELTKLLCKRMSTLYNWDVKPKEIVYLPGLVCGLNAVCRAIGERDSGVLVQTPVYFPFLSAPGNQGRSLDVAQLTQVNQEDTVRHEIDFDAFEAAITPDTRLFILCNPHNPVGRSFTPEELRKMAEICERRDIIICADEIHSDLLFDNTQHTPIATLAPEIANRCITLFAPSKTFNIPGLGCSMAIVQNPKLRKQLARATNGIVPHVNLMGFTGALAAYKEGDEWLTQLLSYLEKNRNFVVEYVTHHLPGVRTTIPEATYLAWLDCSEAGIEGNPHEFFLKEAKVALNDGSLFGAGGENFVRLNFGCSRSTLEQALAQMKDALLK